MRPLFIRSFAFVAGFVSLLTVLPMGSAQACYYYTGGTCTVGDGGGGAATTWWNSNPPFAPQMKQFIMKDIYRDRIIEDWWVKYYRPALQAFTSQIISADVYTTGMLGGMMDGVQVNRSNLVMQELHADALKNYTPGENLCRFGTTVRSLAASQAKSVSVQTALAEIAQSRQLGTRGGSSDTGMGMDRQARLEQFTRLYCDPADNNGMLDGICGGTAPTSTPPRFNKDISVNRTLLGPRTLNIDFTNGNTTADEEDLIALASNLYGPDTLSRMTEIMMAAKGGNADNKNQYLNLRQLVAFRNVAQTSYNVIAGMRARGADGSAIFLKNTLRELGMSDDEAKKYLDTNSGEPSYNAQMEILTKKIYQNPNFYVNLIDKPANVDRQIASMQAFNLMQDRDIYQSFARQEMMLSLLLELKVRREQRDVQRRLKMSGLVN